MAGLRNKINVVETLVNITSKYQCEDNHKSMHLYSKVFSPRSFYNMTNNIIMMLTINCTVIQTSKICDCDLIWSKHNQDLTVIWVWFLLKSWIIYFKGPVLKKIKCLRCETRDLRWHTIVVKLSITYMWATVNINSKSTATIIIVAI